MVNIKDLGQLVTNLATGFLPASIQKEFIKEVDPRFYSFGSAIIETFAGAYLGYCGNAKMGLMAVSVLGFVTAVSGLSRIQISNDEPIGSIYTEVPYRIYKKFKNK